MVSILVGEILRFPDSLHSYRQLPIHCQLVFGCKLKTLVQNQRKHKTFNHHTLRWGTPDFLSTAIKTRSHSVFAVIRIPASFQSYRKTAMQSYCSSNEAGKCWVKHGWIATSFRFIVSDRQPCLMLVSQDKVMDDEATWYEYIHVAGLRLHGK